MSMILVGVDGYALPSSSSTAITITITINFHVSTRVSMVYVYGLLRELVTVAEAAAVVSLEGVGPQLAVVGSRDWS